MEAYFYNDPRIRESVRKILENAISASLLTGVDSAVEFQKGCQSVIQLISLLQAIPTLPSEFLEDIVKQLIEQQLPDARVINSLPTFQPTMDKMLRQGILKGIGASPLDVTDSAIPAFATVNTPSPNMPYYSIPYPNIRQMKAEAQAKSDADTLAEVLANAEARAQADAQALSDALDNTEAQAQADAQTLAEVLANAEAQAQADAQMISDALAHAEAQAQADAQTLAEVLANAEAQAQADAQTLCEVLAQAEAQAKSDAQTLADALTYAEAQTQADALALAEALANAKKQAQADAQMIADALAHAEKQPQAEAEADAAAEAQAVAESNLEVNSKTVLPLQVPKQANLLYRALNILFPKSTVNWNKSLLGRTFLAQVEDILICLDDPEHPCNLKKYHKDGWKVLVCSTEDLTFPRRLERRIRQIQRSNSKVKT